MLRGSLLIAGSLSVSLVGCAGISPPSFELAGVQRNADDGAITILVEATNDNDTPMPLRHAKYSVRLDGERSFEGERSPEVTVPAFGSAVFALPAPVAGEPGEGVEVRGHITFIEPGRLAEILFDSDVRRPEAPLRLSGEVGS